TSGQTAPITKVPYLAFQPQGAGGRTVRFLNREGWSWTIDEVDLPGPPVTATLVAAAVAAETAETGAPAVVKPLSPEAYATPAASTEAAPAGQATADDAPPPAPEALPPPAPEAAPPPAPEVTLAPAPG